MKKYTLLLLFFYLYKRSLQLVCCNTFNYGSVLTFCIGK